MTRTSHRRLLILAQLLTAGGLGLASLWNLAGLVLDLPAWGGWVLALPVPGLLLWPVVAVAPRLLMVDRGQAWSSYRLVYDAGPAWADDRARRALLGIITAGAASLAITWARDGNGLGCWLSIPADYAGVLARVVANVFPGGQLEPDAPPQPGQGLVLLHCHTTPPGLIDLGRLAGIDGVYYRWRSRDTATLALWGPGAEAAAGALTQPEAWLSSEGIALLQPAFVGDNPWPDLPSFPPSEHNPGLVATTRLERLAPALRVSRPALTIGQDGAGYPVGFDLPVLERLRHLGIAGQAAGAGVIDLAAQAIRAKVPLLLLDGRGSAVARLNRPLFRELAREQVVVCDVERPAQSRFRLNPLWLPAQPQVWPDVFATGWLPWLRELGVTPAGLGQAAFRHTQAAVILTAMAAAGRNLALDVPGLRDALTEPEFLGMLDEATLPGASAALGEAGWHWWLAEGRRVPNFEAHVRLGHVRDRLNALLALPAYEMLWQPPYLDPRQAGPVSLLWRLPDPRRQLRAYVSSQLLAISTLLAVWPQAQPLLIILHELPGFDSWCRRYLAHPAVRLVQAGTRLPEGGLEPEPVTWLLSRLHRDDAGTMAARLDGVGAADLRRLPDRRWLLRQGQAVATLEAPAN